MDANHSQAILYLMAEHTQAPPTRIEIRADPIAVERPTNSPPVSRIPCILNLFFDYKSKTAFFKFRLSFGTDQQEDHSLYILVWPEQITSVTVEDDEVTRDPEISRLCNSFRGAVRLHIELSRAGSVVGPQTWPSSLSTVARLESQACPNLQDIQWLGEQIRLTIYISCRTVSMVQLQELCTALSTPGLIKASTLHKDLARMYGGQGGKIIENFSLAVGDDLNVGDENDISTESGSPPPYDEAAAGPSAGPAGPSPGPEQRRSHKPSMKRRRPSSSPESEVALAGIRDPLSFFEGLCNKIWGERQAGFREEVFAGLSRIEARITRTVEERVSQLQDELTDQMEQAGGNAVVAASDLLDEALDDKMTSIRVELEDFIRDELCDVESSIWDQLEAGTWEASFMRRQEHQ